MVHQPKLPLKGLPAPKPPATGTPTQLPLQGLATSDRRRRRRGDAPVAGVRRQNDWRLDDRDRRAGRQGLAAARAALARAEARAAATAA